MADETKPENAEEPTDAPASEEAPATEETVAEEAAAEPTPAEPAAEPTPDVPAPVASDEPTPDVPAPAAEGEGDGEEEPVLDIGSEAVIETHVEGVSVAPLIRGGIDRFGVAMGTGRRKTSVARVRVKSGDGALQINGRSLEDYLCRERDQKMVMAPIVATGQEGKVDVWVRVNGGGTTGQTGAIVLGVARALQAMNPDLHEALADGGFLTRDERMVERKKYGLAKARRSFQFSKR